MKKFSTDEYDADQIYAETEMLTYLRGVSGLQDSKRDDLTFLRNAFGYTSMVNRYTPMASAFAAFTEQVHLGLFELGGSLIVRNDGAILWREVKNDRFDVFDTRYILPTQNITGYNLSLNIDMAILKTPIMGVLDVALNSGSNGAVWLNITRFIPSRDLDAPKLAIWQKDNPNANPDDAIFIRRIMPVLAFSEIKPALEQFYMLIPDSVAITDVLLNMHHFIIDVATGEGLTAAESIQAWPMIPLDVEYDIDRRTVRNLPTHLRKPAV